MIRTLLFVAATLISFSTMAEDDSAPSLVGKKPNIILVVCDDLGYGDLECYGHPHIKTPHLNALAKGGIRFTDFYSAAPVCSPARVGLLTGRSPNRAGVYDFIPGNRGIYLRESEVTFPQLLQKAGYATCLSGKWHCNGKFNSPAQPQPDAAGFDHWFATQNNASPSHANPTNYVRNGEKAGPLEGYSCQIATNEALSWITQQQKADAEQPFFLYLAFHEPHEPIASPPELVEQYLPLARQKEEALYFANVANVDTAVGRLTTELAKMNLSEETLIIFTSDNGPETLSRYSRAKNSFGSAAPLRGMKLWTTEAGCRVPGIISWPGVIERDRVSPLPVSSLDFLPTFLQLAAQEAPKNRTLDGTSILPLFQGKPLQREKPLLWVFYNALNERRVAMRHGDWKIMAKMNIPTYIAVDHKNAEQVKAAILSDYQLFQISDDVGETNDLSKEEVAKLAEMKTLLLKEYEALLSDSHIWDTEGLKIGGHRAQK
ncbi:MAG: sulfatase-like hydrolase/transferase [Roseibacillus sp.]